MYKNEKVACIILNYNDSQTVCSFVEDILNYTVIDHIILVDNCSTDNSYDILSQITSEKIRLFRTEKNGGYGYGNNFGVKVARKEYKCKYAFISNPDVCVAEETLIHLIKIMKKDDKVCACAPLQINGFTNRIIDIFAWRVPTYTDYLVASMICLRMIRSHKELLSDGGCREVECIPGAFLAVNADNFISVGGYDENIFLYCEESVLGYRILDSGYKTILNMEDKYFHYHSTSITKEIKSAVSRQKLLLNSRYYFLKEYRKIGFMKKILAKMVFCISIAEVYIIARFLKQEKINKE